ncbi:MAG TPA: heparinase II/III family protein [Methyloceanibacter sp.]|nr:heparinase II/III family protein [Methyloceanibacter sp.]
MGKAVLMASWSEYLRRAGELPPHVAAKKGLGLIARIWVRERERLIEGLWPSFSLYRHALRLAPIAVAREAVSETTLTALCHLTEQYLQHRFDLLGSGSVDVGYGGAPAGLEGITFGIDDRVQRAAAGGAPWRLVSRANQPSAARIYALIDDPHYRPIDWQRDFRSGYRWGNDQRYTQLGIGAVRGADIKWPWELSRMQHLPQLALAAALAKAGDRRFREPEAYAREIRNQMLDFIALNPPRFGACWGCPMDVGIRAANWVLALSLLKGAGIDLDGAAVQEVAASLHAHAGHIAAHLEWSESGRSNHYLSDLVGLAFCAAVLPDAPESASWLAFAASELVHETDAQFLADGGNYEGSTNYHRLSAELVLCGFALLLGLPKERVSDCDPAVTALLRPPFRRLESFNEAARQLAPKLAAIADFAAAIRRPDGRMVQIGDTDSGRLFKLEPKIEGTGEEEQLAIDDIVDGYAVLLGQRPSKPSVTAAVVSELCRGNTLRAPAPARRKPQTQEELDVLEQMIDALPEERRRRRTFAVLAPERSSLSLAAFPDFGLFMLRGERFFLSFRCAAHAHSGAPSGHTHDDNLSIELFDRDLLVADPGTYVYTPLPEWRNRYRAADAHLAPRSTAWSAVGPANLLFALEQIAKARCLHASLAGFAGVLEHPNGSVWRTVRIAGSTIEIRDGTSSGRLAPVATPPNYCSGYGKNTSRPAFIV